MNVGDLWIDFAFTKPPAANVRDAGYKGVIGYISHDSTKDLQGGQAQAYLNAGLDVAYVWETTATRAAAGYAAGRQDVIEANNAASARGYPAWGVIFYAVDFDASPAGVLSYFDGVHDQGGRPAGIYAGIRPIDSIAGTNTITYGWQTAAWSGGQVSGRAHLYQRSSRTRNIAGIDPSSTDEDVVLRPFPTWRNRSGTGGGGGGVVIPPPPQIDWSPVYAAERAFPMVQQGSTGLNVKKVQGLLQAFGYHLAIDGGFGPVTDQNVRLFQQAHHLTVDGIVGPVTMAHLINDPEM